MTRNKKFYKSVFAIAAGYDVILGVVFFLFYKTVFDIFNIHLPDTPAAYHLLAAFVCVQGIGYYFVSLDLTRNIDLVRVGIIYRLTYASLALYYWATGGLPHIIFALFGLCDLGFAALFVLYLRDYHKLTMETE